MIQKLKHRLVAISMLLISVAVALFYLMGCAAIAWTFRLDVKDRLKDSLDAGAFIFPSIGSDDMNKYGYNGNICVVSYDEFDNTIHIAKSSTAFLDDDVLIQAVTKALSTKEKFDQIPELKLFYYRAETTVGYDLAFTSTSQFESQTNSLLMVGSVAFVITTAVLYLINLFIASLSIKPVERVWEQQQNFIADASHELKTPLTVILTNGNILLSHPDDSIRDQRKWIESTNEEAAHMKDLVEKLLILAKTDNLHKNRMFSSVDLSELAMQLALQFEPVAYEKGVMIHTYIENDIHILGDQTAMNQIIHILLDNAVKYAGLGGQVDLSLRRRQSYVYLSARNTGAPIPPEDLPHVFERFYRSDKARTAGGGYGLGLAICKNLVELHKAQITVCSDEANGTVFTVRFKIDRKT